MTTNVETLRDLFLALWQMQRSAWFSRDPQWKLSQRARDTYDRLVTPWPPIEEKRLTSLFTDREELSINFGSPDGNKLDVLYLPEVSRQRGFVPVLCFEWDTTRVPQRVSSKIMLVTLRECQYADRHSSDLCGIGFRLESGEGHHGFYHSQLQRNLDFGPRITCPDWLPQTQPSFPISANCPVTLVLCVLLSLYGVKDCTKFVNEQGIPALQSALQRIDAWHSGAGT
ncbi:MAG TPA: hypothetical protein VM075_09130 [Anaerolineae bacterium]|nr:hypothetical protein [Anaerolineae bacterium]